LPVGSEILRWNGKKWRSFVTTKEAWYADNEIFYNDNYEGKYADIEIKDRKFPWIRIEINDLVYMGEEE
jgi:hypothetical protein